jgi:hypothetical protein
VNKLGVMVRDLGASELNWRVVQSAHKMTRTDVVLFFDELGPVCFNPPGAAMQSCEAWGYDGPVVATSLATAKKLVGCPGPSAKLFYLWDLEWLRMRDKPYHALRAVYGNPELKLVCRTAEHRELVGRLWGGTVAGVVEDADLTRLAEIASGP